MFIQHPVSVLPNNTKKAIQYVERKNKILDIIVMKIFSANPVV